MTTDSRYRLVGIVVGLVLLTVLFVWAGTVESGPADNNFPRAEEIHDDPETYLGERVTVSGTVVETDPLVVEAAIPDGEPFTVVIENADASPAVGDQLTAHGTLTAERHLEATNVVHREPWEAQYMYLVSFLAGLWVLVRLRTGWTVDTTDWTLLPRDESRSEVR